MDFISTLYQEEHWQSASEVLEVYTERMRYAERTSRLADNAADTAALHLYCLQDMQTELEVSDLPISRDQAMALSLRAWAEQAIESRGIFMGSSEDERWQTMLSKAEQMIQDLREQGIAGKTIAEAVMAVTLMDRFMDVESTMRFAMLNLLHEGLDVTATLARATEKGTDATTAFLSTLGIETRETLEIVTGMIEELAFTIGEELGGHAQKATAQQKARQQPPPRGGK